MHPLVLFSVWTIELSHFKSICNLSFVYLCLDFGICTEIPTRRSHGLYFKGNAEHIIIFPEINHTIQKVNHTKATNLSPSQYVIVHPPIARAYRTFHGNRIPFIEQIPLILYSTIYVCTLFYFAISLRGQPDYLKSITRMLLFLFSTTCIYRSQCILIRFFSSLVQFYHFVLGVHKRFERSENRINSILLERVDSILPCSWFGSGSKN